MMATGAQPESASLFGRQPATGPELSVAPMMDWTDRHCRYFLRLLAPDIRLYTEMVTAHAVVHGDRDHLLRFHATEHPLAVQLGGSDPGLLAEAAAIAAGFGYDEINLNVGCPSDRVVEGSFGACLMKVPRRVAVCVAAMKDAVRIPVTVKTRIGVDDQDDYPSLAAFIAEVAGAGCTTFIVHARKAILGGLSPKENRTIPPLRYDLVYRLKGDFPQLRIVLNGGVDDADAVRGHLARDLDGVMIGRKAYSDPYWLATLQERFLPRSPWQPPDRATVVAAMARYAATELDRGGRLHHITRHMLGLYHGRPGARDWRRRLTAMSADRAAGADALAELAVELAGVTPAGISGPPFTAAANVQFN